MKYMEASDTEQKSYPLKYFKGQDLELYYMEKQLKPGVEREIKEGFFEIQSFKVEGTVFDLSRRLVHRNSMPSGPGMY